MTITSQGEEDTVQGLWGSLSASDFDKVFNDISFPGADLGVWTGGMTDAQGNDWVWQVTGEGAYSQWDGTSILFTAWQTNNNHPDNASNELCMGYIIQSGFTGWDNHTCDGGFNMRSFVVEIPKMQNSGYWADTYNNNSSSTG